MRIVRAILLCCGETLCLLSQAYALNIVDDARANCDMEFSLFVVIASTT
jgi:hypothetical protein